MPMRMILVIQNSNKICLFLNEKLKLSIRASFIDKNSNVTGENRKGHETAIITKVYTRRI